MIEALDGFPDNVVAVSCTGKVTRQDYETVLIPRVNATLARHKAVRLFYEVGPGFGSIDPGAAWTDFKVGVEHLLRWERIAIVTDVDWIRHTIKAFGFLMPAQVRCFANAERVQARAWIAAA